MDGGLWRSRQSRSWTTVFTNGGWRGNATVARTGGHYSKTLSLRNQPDWRSQPVSNIALETHLVSALSFQRLVSKTRCLTVLFQNTT